MILSLMRLTRGWLIQSEASMILSFNSLMLDAGGTQDLYGGQAQNAQIEKKAATSEILGVERDFFRDSQFVSPVNLSPAREPRQKRMNIPSRACGDKIILIEKCRTGSDETHVSLKDAPELWKFIKAGFAQKTADWCQMLFCVAEKMSGNDGCICQHCPKLRH